MVRSILLGIATMSSGATSAREAAPEPLAYEWQNVRVGGGGFAPGIVFSPAEQGLAYLRTDMGGAYRRDATRAEWEPLQDGNAVGSYMGVESIAPDPHDPEVVYLAAGMSARSPASIWRSGDRGMTWRVVEVPFKMGGNEPGRGLGERLAVDPHDTATLFFGSRHDGLWRSGDTGKTWRKVESFPLHGLGMPERRRETYGGLSFVLFDPAIADRIFVGNADPFGVHLYRSDDGGANWRALSGGPAGLLAAKGAIGSDHVLTITFADEVGPNGITHGAVWRYDGERDRWRDVTPEPSLRAPAGGYMGVAVSAQDPQVIAVSTIDRYNPVDTVWRSDDGGAHWSELYRRSTRDISGSPFLKFDGENADFGHWIAGLAIDPFDAGHAAYTTGATLYETGDFDRPGQMQWHPWTDGIEQTAIITMISPTDGPPLVSGFGDIAGFRHDDLAVSPPSMHLNPFLSNTNTLDYAGLAPQIMVRSGSTHAQEVPGASLAWSRDYGLSWLPLAIASAPGDPVRTGDAPIVVSADGGTFIAETRAPTITRDRGKSWYPVEGLPPRLRPTADKVDPRRFYAVDFEREQFLRSDDGGDSFHAISTRGLPDDLSGARTTWREAQNPLRAVPGRAGALWLRLGQALYHSEDFGRSWSRAHGDLSIDHFGLGKGADGGAWPALYAIGTKGGVTGIWRSLDGGASWSRINDDSHQWGLRFRLIIGDPKRFGRVYIGTDGRGIVYGDPMQ